MSAKCLYQIQNFNLIKARIACGCLKCNKCQRISIVCLRILISMEFYIKILIGRVLSRKRTARNVLLLIGFCKKAYKLLMVK